MSCHTLFKKPTLVSGIPRIHSWVYDIAAGLIADLAKADATLANTWKD